MILMCSPRVKSVFSYFDDFGEDCKVILSILRYSVFNVAIVNELSLPLYFLRGCAYTFLRVSSSRK